MIKCEKLSKNYGFEKGIFDCNVNFEKGNVYGLIGHNGAGKTTLIKLITQFVKPTDGKIEKKLTYNEGLKSISYMPDFEFFINGNVKKNLEFFSYTNKDFRFDVFDNMINYFDITKNDKIRNLSTGKLKALKFIFCVARDTDVYIFDEPLASIDVVTRKKIIKEMLKYIDIENKCVIISSHELHDLDNLLDYVILIENGHIIGNYEVEKIKENSNDSLYQWYMDLYNKEIEGE